jgi:PPM family protein phosphatase
MATALGKMPDRSIAALNFDMPDHEKHAYEVAAASDKGRVRATNEDAYGYCEAAGIFVVCDGMGGAAAGEVASRITVEAVLEPFCNSSTQELKEVSFTSAEKKSLLSEVVATANQRVFSQAERDAKLHGMGTTLVALLVDSKRAWVVHVGDSRCYLWRNGKLQQWTQDHSLVDEQVRLGQLTREEAERSPLRNVITRAVGSQPSVTPELDDVAIEPGDVFLLCSDGLTREVTDEQIAATLSRTEELESGCQLLIDAANTHGGRDNITCVLVRAK